MLLRRRTKMYWRLKEMKKLIASLLVLVFGATMVMAEVPAVAVNSEQVIASEAAFAEVEVIPLGEAESADVKGGLAPLAAFAVGVGVRAVGSAVVASATEYALTGHVTAKNVIIGAVSGAVTGGVGGIFAKSSTTVAQMARSAAQGAIASGAGATAATIR